jgi:endonuclease YncB( thermonuclease family)
MLQGMKRLLALALAVTASTTQAALIEGRVIEVPDGATITVLSRQGASLHRIRIAGIDAPRTGRDDGPSRASLRRLVGGKNVRVETSGIDSKGLLIGVVHVVQPEACNSPCAPFSDPGLTQLSYGMAVIERSNLSLQSSGAKERYLAAESYARSHRLGVWRADATAHVRMDRLR